MGDAMPDPFHTAPALDLDRALADTLDRGDRTPAIMLLTGLWQVTATDRATRLAEMDTACGVLADRIRNAHFRHLLHPAAVTAWVGTRLGPVVADQVRDLDPLDPDTNRTARGPMRLPCLLWYTAGMVATAGNGALAWWHRLDLRVPAQRTGPLLGAVPPQPSGH